MLKLYSAPLSLFGKKVELALGEKGLDFERVLVPFSQSKGYAPKHPDVLAINPKGQVPVLIDRDLRLYDSTVILEYLEDAYPQVALYPRAPDERACCRQLELYADEVMLVPLRALMHRTGPHPADAALWADWEEKAGRAEVALTEQFADLDRLLAGGRYLCGDLSVADIACFMIIFYAQRLGGPGLAAHQSLSAWYRDLKARPAFAAVTADIARADRELSVPVDGAYKA